MSNGIRITGMNSGLDTEGMVKALMDVKNQKVELTKLKQKQQSWKQDAWKDLNTKVNSFFNGTLSKMKYSDVYSQKKTVASNTSIANVITGSTAINGTQKLYVDQLAQTAFLTGAKLAQTYTGTTKLSEIEDATGMLSTGTLSITKNGTTEEISLGPDATINDLVAKLKEKGINANFDKKNQRLFLSSKEMGKDNDFEISGTGNMLQALGLDTSNADATKIDAKDAKIRLNGVEFASAKNTFEVNGLTINVTATSTEEISLATADDTDGIYDLVKDFIKGYNEIINEMDKLFNAESATKYKMLTDDQREEMSDTDTKEWDGKIKNALLRKDDTLRSFSSIMKDIMLKPVSVNGKNVYLSDFGINTMSYFEAADNEKNALHINGDEDNGTMVGKSNDLKNMISTNPKDVSDFFISLTRDLYSSMYDAMAKTKLSSMFTVYNDIKMKEDYTDYTKKIANLEKKLAQIEDRYYKKFSAMEVALAKMESNSNAVSSLLGL